MLQLEVRIGWRMRGETTLYPEGDDVETAVPSESRAGMKRPAGPERQRSHVIRSPKPRPGCARLPRVWIGVLHPRAHLCRAD